MKGFSQAVYGIAMKAHTIMDPGNPARENTIFVVVFDAGGIALPGYGVTLLGFRKPLVSCIW